MGRAIMIRYGEAIWGVTAELTVRFRKPVPLGVELTAIGRITHEGSRLFEGTGELYLPDGTVAVEASGKYVKLDIQQDRGLRPRARGVVREAGLRTWNW